MAVISCLAGSLTDANQLAEVGISSLKRNGNREIRETICRTDGINTEQMHVIWMTNTDPDRQSTAQ